MYDAIIHHLLTYAQTAPQQQSPASFPLSLYPEQDVIGYGISYGSVRVSCAGCISSQLLVCSSPLTGEVVLEAEKSLSQSKYCLAAAKTLVCQQHYSHLKSKTQNCDSYFYLSRNQNPLVEGIVNDLPYLKITC